MTSHDKQLQDPMTTATLKNPMEVLLDSKEAAKYLGVSGSYMRWMRNQSKGPKYLKLDGWAVRYRLADIDNYISHQEAQIFA